MTAPSAQIAPLGSRILKVRIPVDMYLSLHRRKILTGKTLSKTVQDALTMFLGPA